MPEPRWEPTVIAMGHNGRPCRWWTRVHEHDGVVEISGEWRPDDPPMTVAPWTAEQVAALNRWQQAGFVHPFTCPNEHPAAFPEWRILLATRNGWFCEMCGYRQMWAHAFMLEEPVNPVGAGLPKS